MADRKDTGIHTGQAIPVHPIHTGSLIFEPSADDPQSGDIVHRNHNGDELARTVGVARPWWAQPIEII